MLRLARRMAEEVGCVGVVVDAKPDAQAFYLVEAHLLKVNRTRALVQNSLDGKRWTIPFYLINLDGQDVAIAARQRRGLDRNSLKVGDRVAPGAHLGGDPRRG